MLEPILWQDQYLVGVAKIDVQHQRLFNLYNDLLVAFNEGNLSVVGSAFEEMASYLDQHFSTEEKYWRLDEDIYHEHRKLHFDFVKYVLAETKNSSSPENLASVLGFLSTWLIDHIQTVDKMQFEQLRSQGLL